MLWDKEIKLDKSGEKRKYKVLKIRLRTMKFYFVISSNRLKITSLSQ